MAQRGPVHGAARARLLSPAQASVPCARHLEARVWRPGSDGRGSGSLRLWPVAAWVGSAPAAAGSEDGGGALRAAWPTRFGGGARSAEGGAQSARGRAESGSARSNGAATGVGSVHGDVCARAWRCRRLRVVADHATSGGVMHRAQRPWKLSDARLVLEDGSVWRAKSFGASGTQVGEVVFNTSLTGYQEILTDPSYAGQFVLMTNPHIGNTGVNPDDEESNQCFLGGLIIRNLSICTSNWRCTETLEEYLIKRNIMGIYDVDTRAITRRLREDGSLIGVLSTDQSRTDDELLEMARKWKIVGVDLISGVTCDAPYVWSDKTDLEWEFKKDQSSESFHVVAYDFGIKHNILRRLTSYGCHITVVPANWPASEVLNLKPDGVLFSNGPGDPAAVPYAVKTVQEIIGKVPVFGICMGHQLIGQALGGKTFKMKFGHHGGNHPVCDLRSGRVDISAQNHNYAVDPQSLPEGVKVTHINLNDNSCAGLQYPKMNLMSLQYHPESSPGPHDSDTAFGEFIEVMKNRL